MNTAAVIPEMTDQDRVEWLQAEIQAIRQRSAAEIARAADEMDRAIDEGVNFFAACGARDAAAVRQEANQ